MNQLLHQRLSHLLCHPPYQTCVRLFNRHRYQHPTQVSSQAIPLMWLHLGNHRGSPAGNQQSSQRNNLTRNRRRGQVDSQVFNLIEFLQINLLLVRRGNRRLFPLLNHPINQLVIRPHNQVHVHHKNLALNQLLNLPHNHRRYLQINLRSSLVLFRQISRLFSLHGNPRSSPQNNPLTNHSEILQGSQLTTQLECLVISHRANRANSHLGSRVAIRLLNHQINRLPSQVPNRV